MRGTEALIRWPLASLRGARRPILLSTFDRYGVPSHDRTRQVLALGDRRGFSRLWWSPPDRRRSTPMRRTALRITNAISAKNGLGSLKVNTKYRLRGLKN